MLHWWTRILSSIAVTAASYVSLYWHSILDMWKHIPLWLLDLKLRRIKFEIRRKIIQITERSVSICLILSVAFLLAGAITLGRNAHNRPPYAAVLISGSFLLGIFFSALGVFLLVKHYRTQRK